MNTYSSVVAVILIGFVHSSQGSLLFEDQFSGTSLDSSKWSILDGSAGISVSGGYLQSSGSPDHKRINSTSSFGVNVIASALITANGDYKAFGFGVNTGTGYFFDTYTSRGFVRVIAYEGGLAEPAMNKEVALTWEQPHEFSIERTASHVYYIVDGMTIGDFTPTFVGDLPVGVWNDRQSSMLTDWVKVQAVPEPSTYLAGISALGMLGMFGWRNRK